MRRVNMCKDAVINVAYTGATWHEWIIFKNDIMQLWDRQPTYLYSQAMFIVAGFITLIHALNKGGRWPYFWLGTVLHGIYADNFWHFILPDYDNFWHSQTPIMLLGARLPLHIILLYPAFLYHAAYSVSKLHLPFYAEPFAVGLVTVLIDIPYDIVSVKFVHWTWHDTDPNIYDRHYWVPWNSYYFHATFAASFYFFFIKIRSYYDSITSQWKTSSRINEWKTLTLATLLGMPGGVLLFVPIYHPLHDTYKIHSEVTFFMLASIYMVFIINGLLRRNKHETSELKPIDYVLILQLAAHYLLFLAFVVFFNPEQEISTGLHEPVGPCHEMSSLVTPFGQTLEKRKYFCPSDYNEDYFNFHCVGGLEPSDGDNWYTVCGTPFQNRYEYIVILSTILFAASGIFYGIYFGSQPMKLEKIKVKSGEATKKRTKLKFN